MQVTDDARARTAPAPRSRLWQLAHSSEPDALPTLHTIIGYVTNFFGCQECVGH